MSDALKLYFVVGEESGDALGASLMDEFLARKHKVDAVGLAGPKLGKHGVASLFDISEISVMGFSGVIAKLPRLLSLIRKTASDVVRQNPDVLVLIDSPEFSYRVAQKVRASAPHIKIVKFVAPSVWAWREGRAKKIAPYIDHILAILPFEPKIMAELGGPKTTFVGHPLGSKLPEVDFAAKERVGDPVNIVALPGSRRSESKRLLPIIGQTFQIMLERGNRFSVTIPAVPSLKADIEAETAGWACDVTVVSSEDAKLAAFSECDVALAASGTATLELAIYGVPMIAIYKLDPVAMSLRHLLKGWSASLPNLIVDYPLVPERYNENAHPGYLARSLEQLTSDQTLRKVQLNGFKQVRSELQLKVPSASRAVDIIIEEATKKGG